MNQFTTIGFPVLFCFFTVLSCIKLSFVLKRKEITTKAWITWLTLNIIFLFLTTYLLIIGIVYSIVGDSFPYEKFNFLDWIGYYGFGIEKNSWVIFLILFITFISIIVSINMMVKHHSLNKKVNDLNRNIAILKGKIAIEIDDLNFDTAELSADELKLLLEEQLTKEKLKNKYKTKFKRVLNNEEIEIDLDSKTLLNIKDKRDNDKKYH